MATGPPGAACPPCPKLARTLPKRSCRSNGFVWYPGARLTQRAGRIFDQRPAFGAKHTLPLAVDRREPRPERALVGVVEHQPARHEVRAQAGIERGLIGALLAHILGGIALDHRLDVRRQVLPDRKM